MKIENSYEPSLESSILARNSGNIETWVHSFLNGEGNNKQLSEGLNKEQRWWIGPLEFELKTLKLTTGPGREYHEENAHWNNRIKNIVKAIKEGKEMPPLIAEWKTDTKELSLADGNHRCQGLIDSGFKKYWVITWFNKKEDYQYFLNKKL